MMLQDAVGKERRPLSWTIGDQQVIKPDKISQRDQLTESRMQATDLRKPDTV
jgi:NADH-quinone oxidoreductase subunit B